MDERKKVLYLITKGNFGGAQRYVYDLATHLPKDKFNIVVACGEGNLLIEKLKEANIRTIKIEGLGREVEVNKDFEVLKNLIKIIKEEKPSIIHLNSSKIGLLGALAILYSKLYSIFNIQYSIPYSIFTSHGWGFYETHRSLMARIFFYFSHWFTVIICDKTIAVSYKTKNDISFLPFIKNKIEVIHNGIEKFDVLPYEESIKILDPKNFNKNPSVNSGQVILFSISELHKNKGLDIALRGLALLPKETRDQLIYTIAGSGEEKENLEKLAESLGIGDMINFLGFVDNAKQYLSGAGIFIFPSRTENLPYAILEAGFANIPIISTSVGGIPEIIRDMQNGILIHPQNPKEIAEAILYILDHPDKQKEFGSAIQKTVSNFFSLSKMLSETIEVYKI